MLQLTLEQRVCALEEAMAEIVAQRNGGPTGEKRQRDWRRTIGMFDGDPVWADIQEEGRKIREAEREALRRDSNS